MVIMVLAFPIYRLTEPDRRADAAEGRATELAAQGEELYALTCAGCHGPEGKGGATAPTLNAKEFLQFVADEQIESLIAVGVPGSQMSAYSLDFGGPFTQEQIVALTAYLRSLEADAPSVPNWWEGASADETPTTTTASDPMPPSRDEGAELFATLCAGCHGSELGGGAGPALGPGSSAADQTDEDMSRAISAGEGAMPAFGSSLSDAQIDALVDFMRSVQEAG
jgi:mono/diheme cytochrome c family protein